MRPTPIAALLLLTAALALPQTALTESGTVVPTDCSSIAREVYALKGWRHKPATERLAGCNVPTKKLKADFYEYRLYRQHTPYPGFHGEGIWLEHLAIPAYIVACETQGYHGMGRYRVRGGGDGAYQIQPPTWHRWGGGKFAPHADQASPAQQAVVAQRILHGQGFSAWACA